MDAVQNLSSQMFRGIEWLHRNNVVHRDVKAENYLMDRPNLDHPSCRVCLSDFGLAAELPQGSEERLHELCGTENYWAPECYAEDYGFKVDVWAAGVIMYGLVSGHFPFQSEKEVLTKRIEVSARCWPTGESFLLSTLTRAEAERLSASEALQHPFLASAESVVRAVGPSSELSFWPQARKVGRCSGDEVHASLSSSSRTSEASSSGSDEHRSRSDSTTIRDALADLRRRVMPDKLGVSCLGGVARLLSVVL